MANYDNSNANEWSFGTRAIHAGHPASTTHSQSDEAGLARAGITQATVRLSVGIEDIDDILADLDRGFAAI